MSSSIKRKSKQFAKVIESKARVHDSMEDRIIVDASDKVSSALYLILKDEYGFGAQKILNFYRKTKEVNGEEDTDKLSDYLIEYTNLNGIPVYTFVKDIPSSKKLILMEQKKVRGDVSRLIKLMDAAMILVLSLSVIVLKENYRFSNVKIMNVLDSIRKHIDSMVTFQPKCKAPYLTKKMIRDALLDELHLDISTGKKVKHEKKS